MPRWLAATGSRDLVPQAQRTLLLTFPPKPTLTLCSLRCAMLCCAFRAALQGAEQELALEPGNAYQRAIQYQQLRRDQFGAAAPPGFIVGKGENEVGGWASRWAGSFAGLSRAALLGILCWKGGRRKGRRV